MRGEYLLQSHFAKINVELPPRARRIQLPTVATMQKIGTTSACAENTRHQAHEMAASRNYLRVRGEYYTAAVGSPCIGELPPRARRIRPRGAHGIDDGGTTSACAENTHSTFDFGNFHWNYLRVRGEYHVRVLGPKGSMELPPRARRIRQKVLLDGLRGGTTSACAENT